MKELLIFYFSGTGNARQVAQWIKDDVMEKGVNCSLYDITQHDINEITIDNEACIGIISPVHGFNYPPIMLNFMIILNWVINNFEYSPIFITFASIIKTSSK